MLIVSVVSRVPNSTSETGTTGADSVDEILLLFTTPKILNKIKAKIFPVSSNLFVLP